MPIKLTVDIVDINGLQTALDLKADKGTGSGGVGPQGPAGKDGLPGKDGVPGKDGTSGSGTGSKGDKGDKGDTGSQGIQGLPGKDGTGGGGTSQSVLNIHSVKDFGVSSRNPDNIIAFEKARDYAYANDATLFIPQGNYHISRSWVLRNKATTFSTINIYGESMPWSSRLGSNIIADFNDAPIISMQLNKGSIISGISPVGKFNPPTMDAAHWKDAAYWITPFEKWGSGARDSRYSPQCGIAIDAFCNVGFPPDGGYPTLKAEYNLNPEIGSGGSQGVHILNFVPRNCVVGVCCSPNGQTQNNEEAVVDNIDFTNCKTGVSGGQPQEKNNI